MSKAFKDVWSILKDERHEWCDSLGQEVKARLVVTRSGVSVDLVIDGDLVPARDFATEQAARRWMTEIRTSPLVP